MRSGLEKLDTDSYDEDLIPVFTKELRRALRVALD